MSRKFNKLEVAVGVYDHEMRLRGVKGRARKAADKVNKSLAAYEPLSPLQRAKMAVFAAENTLGEDHE